MRGHRRSTFKRLLASAKRQGEAQPQQEFAGASLQRSEEGWNEFAARARHPCQAPGSQQCQGNAKDLRAYPDMPLQFVAAYEHKDRGG